MAVIMPVCELFIRSCRRGGPALARLFENASLLEGLSPSKLIQEFVGRLQGQFSNHGAEFLQERVSILRKERGERGERLLVDQGGTVPLQTHSRGGT